ncbi:MAG: AAA family ATPase [Candidatus Aenigmarchaeota archaeon]|nr:AAA family ATPase [Candidatus Aenigmarchaeota archaeon]NIQ18447.1 AAA family ATPase [Candidatus Aenigmarchaeota archaeon]NIS73331.1 AAA family ATPase [Candidatus Aenigmarchaeota archaeon]
MVRLEKVVLQGFKSFKRPTSMAFPSNFAVVTGPNGCGKSNVGDSISFVLGKTSPKHLRAKKAQDLIFHGSKNKKPSDYAKVNLMFSNGSKVLPFDEKEISVSRRLNKAGISSYKLNGKISTRQRILDIFIQARMNPGGHNMIRQGDVTKVIEMNPVERREVIDEISGIKEYDEKRNHALKQLEKVEEKVREAEIILEQKEEIIEKMRKDRDSALEYRNLTNELELVKSTIVWKEFTSSEKNIGSLEKNIEEKEGGLEKLEKEIKGIDREMEEKDREMESLMKEVMKKDQVEITKKISKIESSLDSKENLIRSNEREIERLTEMVKNLSTMKGTPDHLKPVLELKGVHGFVKDLIIVPDKYRVSAEVAGGTHMNDIVVDTLGTAIHCVKYLKEEKIGRARFLPLDKIRSSPKPSLPQGTLGWLSELIHHDREYIPVVEYVFGRTACVNDIDKAKKIAEKNRIRMVTIDGDIFETSGAVFGGHYIRQAKPETKKYLKEKEKLDEENHILRMEIEELKEKLKEMRKGVKETGTFDFERKRAKIKEEIEALRDKRSGTYDKRMNLQEELNRFKINKARYEANFDNLRIQWEEHKKTWKSLENKEIYQKKSVSSLKDREKEILESISSIGPVNLKAIEEFEILYEEFEEFRERVEKISEEKESVIKSITEIENRKREVFMQTLEDMGKLFKKIYSDLTKGEAELGLDDPMDINSGLLISAQPPNKKLLYIDAMSGGEKVLTALAFLFTIQRYKPSPFYLLDEIDAALDRPNTRRVVDMIKSQSKDVQFIIISHNNEMVKAADIVYGISMEDGESKVMGLKLPEN